jgi:hypothetical protein
MGGTERGNDNGREQRRRAEEDRDDGRDAAAQ